ncbi:hypothetical protein P4O66_010262, partial [Electrophorus voltai]
PKDNIAYTFLTSWIGEGLLVSAGQKWFRHRRLLTPGFHYILKPYVKLMADSANIMLDKWETYAKTEQSFELFQQVSLMTLDSIMKCAFSYNSNCQTESGTNPYIKAVFELCYLVHLRWRWFPYHSETIFHLSPHGYRYRKACKIAHSHTEEVIRKRKEALSKEKKQDILLKRRNLDFLDILLCTQDEQQQGLSDEAIRAEVDTFMFEGHDTTASGISWILYNMACYPEHQQKCREEIQEALKGKDSMECTFTFCLLVHPLEQLRGARYFTKLDLCSACNLIPIREVNNGKWPLAQTQVLSLASVFMESTKMPQFGRTPMCLIHYDFCQRTLLIGHPFVPLSAGP